MQNCQAKSVEENNVLRMFIQVVCNTERIHANSHWDIHSSLMCLMCRPNKSDRLEISVIKHLSIRENVTNFLEIPFQQMMILQWNV